MGRRSVSRGRAMEQISSSVRSFLPICRFPYTVANMPLTPTAWEHTLENTYLPSPMSEVKKMRMAVFWDSCIICLGRLSTVTIWSYWVFLVEKQNEKPFIYHQSAWIEHNYCHTSSNRSHYSFFPELFIILYSLWFYIPSKKRTK